MTPGLRTVFYPSIAVFAVACYVQQPTQPAPVAMAWPVPAPVRTPVGAVPAAATAPKALPIDRSLPRPDVIALSAPIPGFTKGINLGNCFDAPSEGAWGTVISEKHFEMAAAAGFDHVRLPTRFSAPERADVTPPYAIQEEFFKRVDWAIDQALAHHLSIIVDLHHYEELNKHPNAHKQRLYALWQQIAARYKKRPPQVAFEIVNEPNGALEPKILNEITHEALKIIRATNPKRIVFADPYFWASAKNLSEFELPPDDANVIAQFHVYEPILFTHQGAPWMAPPFQTSGIIFPGPPSTPVTPLPTAAAASWVKDWFQGYNTLPAAENPGGPRTVFELFDLAARYVKVSGKRVYLGEFGAVENADAQSRENYVWLVRTEAERRGIGWAYWDDGGMFKAVDPTTGIWNDSLRRALLDH